jgi:hypothetical protein
MNNLADANYKSAIEAARPFGATTPRKAAETIAGRKLSDREWEIVRDGWERNWSQTSPYDQPSRIEHTFSVVRRIGPPRLKSHIFRKACDFLQKRSERRRWWKDYRIRDKQFRKAHRWDDSRGEWIRNDGQPMVDKAWSPLGALLDRIEKKGRLDELDPGLW